MDMDCWNLNGGFNASMFIKDEEDILNALRVLKNNFNMH